MAMIDSDNTDEDVAEIGEVYLQELNEFLEELNSPEFAELEGLLSIWDEFMGDFDKEVALVPIAEIC